MFPILWLALWLFGQQTRLAPPPPPSIQGVVVRAGAAAAGAPEGLPDARVELTPGNVSVNTNASGNFAFRNLAPGRYTLSVTHDGFVPQEDPGRGFTELGYSFTFADGQTLKDIVLPMIWSPVITGSVIDPHGSPLAAALVRAYQRQYSPYGTRLKVVKKAMTDDMGEFRLFGLNFGEFFVSAAYSDRDRGTALGKTQLSANVSRADDGYATTFYDGAEDISRAQAAHLTPGFVASPLNINLRDSPRFRIRGQVLPVPLPSGAGVLMVPKGSDLTESDYSITPDAGGAFEIRAVSPGSYLLAAATDDGAFSSDVVALNVTDSDIGGVRLALEPTMTVSGALSLEGSATASLSRYHVKLVRSNVEFDQKIDTRPSPDDAFALEHVIPSAAYDVVVEPLPPGTYVKSVTSALRNVLPGQSRLRSDERLRIVLAAATDSLDVHVTSGSRPAAGMRVVLIPEPLLRRRADRYITGFTNETGDLHLAVPPGKYTAYAFEKIEAGAYYVLSTNPAADNGFRDRGVSVVIGEKGDKTIQLTLVPASVTAGGLQ